MKTVVTAHLEIETGQAGESQEIKVTFANSLF
jgi:hypothetical protein